MVATVAPAAIISDDFNRIDGTDLGRTVEGYAWGRYGTDAAKPAIANGTMYFGDSYSMLTLADAPKTKDYSLDMYISRPAEPWGVSYFIVNFRMDYQQETLGAGGTNNGYSLRYFSDVDNNTIWATLYEDKSHTGAEGAEEYALASSVGRPISVASAIAAQHVALTVIGSVITVSLNGTEVINYDGSGSSNPASTGEGYINFQAANNRHFAMDNLSITVPLPPAENDADLGQTVEGYAWGRYGTDADKPSITNGTMYFGDSYSRLILTDAPKTKDYSLDMDISRPTEPWGTSYFIVNFRMDYENATLGTGGTDNGYSIRFFSNPDLGFDTLWAELCDDKGHHPGATGAEEYTLASSAEDPLFVADATAPHHVAMTVKGSVITVSINGDEVIRYDASGSSNPASTGEGYINFQAASNRHFAMDNLWVVAPETGYNAWTGDWGGYIGSKTNDLDGDLLNNLAEFAFGGDPTDPTDRGYSPIVVTTEIGGTNVLAYVYPCMEDENSGLTYSLELCTDLISPVWTNSGYITLNETGSFGAGFEAVTNLVPTDLKRNQFIRLIVVEGE